MTHTLTLHRYNNTDPRLGRHVNHDSRNHAYALPAWSMLDLASSAKYFSEMPVLNQGQVGACTGFAGAGLLGYSRYLDHLTDDQKTTLRTSGNALGLTFYHTATTLDNIPGTYPPNDSGSDGPSSAKGMTKLGWTNGHRHAFSWNSLLTALQYAPVMVGTEWYESMMDTSGAGATVTVDLRSSLAGGHEYVCDGYDGGWMYFLNSWGESFGNRGHFRISVYDFQALLGRQGDITVPVPLTAPAPVPNPTPVPVPKPTVDTDVADAYHSLRSYMQRNGLA